MNAPISASRIAPTAGTGIDADERALRVQLAAAYGSPTISAGRS